MGCGTEICRSENRTCKREPYNQESADGNYHRQKETGTDKPLEGVKFVIWNKDKEDPIDPGMQSIKRSTLQMQTEKSDYYI